MSTPSSSKNPILCAKTATVMGIVFLTLFALFTLLVAIDKTHRPRLEAIQMLGK